MLRLRELRLNKGFSQTKLAEILGVTYFSIGDWERGKCQPSIELLLKLSDVFECSVDYLIGREDDFGNVTIAGNGDELSEQEKELLKNFNKLSIFERDSILVQIEALAKKQLIKK